MATNIPMAMFQLGFDFLFRRRAVIAMEKPSALRTPDSFPWKHGILVHVVRPARLKRYLLKLQGDGSARLAIPRRGSRAEAMRFLERSEAWLRKRHEQWLAQAARRQPWRDGATFLYRGMEARLGVKSAASHVSLSFADQISPSPVADDYRPAVQAHLRALAERELPVRTRELAQEHGVSIRSVTVRAQTTRWGSCSSRGTISLNWRLIQAPPLVVDYLIVHELMHRREMNHSARYWKLVAAAFPRYREAEAWLKKTRLEGLI
jgi:predicted metal-dependent hydrolase